MPNDMSTSKGCATGMPSLHVADCGVVAYREMRERQLRLFDAMVDCKRHGLPVSEEHILLVEHNPVYTLGRHGHAENMLVTPRILEARGIECVRIERGGDITYHGPGQLVVYPILDLEAHHLGVKSYITLLEEAVMLTLAGYGIRGERVAGATGVWIDCGTPRERKICAIGVRCSRYVSMHGLALNVNTDLSYFDAINPCGFVDKGVTSIQREVGHAIPMADVKNSMTSHLLELLA